jgi:hypothetical protein
LPADFPKKIDNKPVTQSKTFGVKSPIRGGSISVQASFYIKKIEKDHIKRRIKPEWKIPHILYKIIDERFEYAQHKCSQ